MEFDRHVAGIRQDDRHEGADAFRRDQGAGILEAEPLGPERRCLPGLLGVVLVGVLRRIRIDEIEDDVQPVPLCECQLLAPAIRGIR